MDSVIDVLNSCGIAGAVTFELQSGSHAGGTIGAVNGASATNTITLSGANAANDTLGALVLNGASYINLEDLYIFVTGGFAVRLNGTDNVNITGSTIETSSAASTANIAIVASASATSYSSATVGETNLTITDNTLKGGYYSMVFYGSSAMLGATHDVEISNNTITDAYYYGIYVYYARDVEIAENNIGNFTNTYNYGAYLRNIDGCIFTKNMVESYYSVYAYYLSTSSDATLDSEISNNMLNNGYYGLRVYYGSDIGVYHNTCVGSYYGFYDYYNASGTDIRNNIFQGGTYALYSYNSSASLDYNLYHSLGSNLAYIYNGSYNYPTDSASLAAVDTTKNQNSWVGDPIFAGANDLHVYGQVANDRGDNTVGITEDIDGDTRPMSGSTIVDIGADEFDVLVDDAALVALVSPTNSICGDDSLMVSVAVANFGTDTITSMTVSADVMGQTLSATPTSLSIPFGGKDTIELGYVSNYVGGPMSVVAYTQLTGDGRTGNDTLSVMVNIADAQQVSVNYVSLICSGDDAVLVPTHPKSGNLLWLSGSDTIAIAPADSAISMTVNHDTTITVSALSSSTSIQNTKGIGTGGSNYNFYGTVGVLFSATQAFLLDSVTLYPNAAGSTSIEIQDVSSGSVVWSGSVSTTATGNTAEQVSIGAQIQPGSYRMVATASTTGGLYREYGVTGYPFSTTGGEVSITQGTLTNYHYFFYEWVVTVGGCSRADTTFTLEAVGSPDTIGSPKKLFEICDGQSIDISAPAAEFYSWSTGDSSRVITVDTAGIFVVQSDFPGCYLGYDTIEVVVNTLPSPSLSYTNQGIICNGDSINISLASGSYSYLWNTGSMDQSIYVDDSVQVYATILDTVTQCSVQSDTLNTSVVALPSSALTILTAGTTVCNGDSVSVLSDANGTYAWNTGDSTQNVSIGASGSYWAHVTDSNGCSVQTDTIAVTVNPLPVEVITNTGSSVYCDGDSTILTFTGQNAYQWSTGDTTDDITVYTSGDYFAMLTDSNGCQNYSDTVAITVNDLPSDSLVISGNTEFCQGDSLIIGALTNASYLWSTGDTTQQVVVSSTSVITGVVTDANGCMRQLDTAQVTVNSLPNDSIYAAGPTTFCLGDSVTILSADASATHLWSTGDTTSSIVATAVGLYYVGLVSDKGCIAASDTIDVVVNPNPNPVVTINGSLDLCPGDSVTLEGNPGLTYYWSTGDSTQSITLSQSASVVLDVTNSFGCSATSSTQDVVLHPFPTTSQILGDTVGIIPLTNYNYVVTQTPGHTYQWTATNGAVISGQGTNVVTVMWSQDTTGSLTVVESNGYCNDTASVEIRTNIGIEDVVKSNIKLYPNPTQGRLIVQGEEALGAYVIYNMTGAVMASGRTENWEIRLDLSNYPSGVYWLNVQGNRYRVVLLD